MRALVVPFALLRGRAPSAAAALPACAVRRWASTTTQATTQPTAESPTANGAEQPRRTVISTKFLADLLNDDKRQTLGGLAASRPSLQPQEKPQGRRLQVTARTDPVRRCYICTNKIEVDYKNVRLLSQFVSEHTGRILPRRMTGNCARSQAEIRTAIQRARQAGLMPFLYKLPRFSYKLEGSVWD